MTIEAERERSRRQGVRREENLPFLLVPEGGTSAAALLVHGFSASPWEMRPAGEALRAAGIAALGIRLPGHGTSPEDLEGRTWQEWLEGVSRGMDLLSGYRRVYGVGMSTGSLLLLALASKRPLGGLALLSPFLRIQHPLSSLAGVLHHIRRWHTVQQPPQSAPFYYGRRPVAGIAEINRLVRQVKGTLERISVPALVMGGLGDETVEVEGMYRIFSRLGHSRKEFHLFGPEVPHVLLGEDNPRRGDVLELLVKFLLSLEEFHS